MKFTKLNYSLCRGLINCIYVNHQAGKFWVIDYRIYDPSGDGKTKIDHVLDMLERTLPARTEGNIKVF